MQPRARKLHGSTVIVAMAVAAALAAGCAAPDAQQMTPEDAVACSELGAGLVYVQYETEATGTVGVMRSSVDREQAELISELPEQALEVLEVRGWDSDSLAELSGGDELGVETQELLDEMPSCLDDYLAANT